VNSSRWSAVDIRIYAVLASLLISLFTILFPDPPNADAFDYIRTADIVLEDGLVAAFDHYSWASYPILIATIEGLFGADPFVAAYTVNALFYALLIYSFLSIIREIDDSRLLLFIAAITILTYPQLNEFRYEIIRDIGFWAFSLFGTWQFLLLGKSRQLKYALGFCMAFLVAAALRVEALLYLIVIPFSLLLDTRCTKDQRRRLLVRIFGILFFGGLGLSLILLLAGIDIISLLIDFVSVYAPFVAELTQTSEVESFALGQILFNEHAAGYSTTYITLFTAAGLFAIVMAKLIVGIGGPSILVLLFGFFKNYYRLPGFTAAPVIAFCLTNALIVFAFIFLTRYMSTRYLMLSSLMVAFMVPLIIYRTLKHAANSKNKLLAKRIFAFFFLYCIIDSFYSFGRDKTYVNDTIEWIEANTSASSSLITNNHSIAYFSGLVEDYDKTLPRIDESQISEAAAGTFIILEMHYEASQLIEGENLAPLLELRATFPEESDPRLAVYQRR
tara:strand:+ start:3128 stop:4633 length:1506 start_codon:yes stop_codon:yes gene_type:complete